MNGCLGRGKLFSLPPGGFFTRLWGKRDFELSSKKLASFHGSKIDQTSKVIQVALYLLNVKVDLIVSLVASTHSSTVILGPWLCISKANSNVWLFLWIARGF